eukprot:3090588-Alexandrium_andersonii.AAC.1
MSPLLALARPWVPPLIPSMITSRSSSSRRPKSASNCPLSRWSRSALRDGVVSSVERRSSSSESARCWSSVWSWWWP